MRNLISTFFAILLLSNFSCMDDSVLNEPEYDNNVNLAKNWFAESFDSNSLSQTGNRQINFKSKTVLWGRGISHSKNGKIIVEVPLNYESDLTAHTGDIQKGRDFKNLTKLLLFKSRDGYHVFIMRIIPSPESLSNIDKNTYHLKDKNFTGEIIYSDWHERPIILVKYENGERKEIKNFKKMSQNEIEGNQIASERTNSYVCDFVTVHWYQLACSQHGCTESYLGFETYYVCTQSNQDEWFATS